MPTILLKKSDTPSAVPTTANLTNLAGGVEVAVNTADRRMFTMTSASAVVELGNNPTSLNITTGDLAFTGTGQRITGDMSNATAASRLSFQSSTTNGNTTLGVLPNGTATAAVVSVFANSDPANTSLTAMGVNSAVSESFINANRTGTGTYLPMTFYTGGSERMRLDTSGNLGIGTASPVYKLDVNTGVAGNIARFTDGVAQTLVVQTPNANGVILKNDNNGYIAFGTSAERMRIDSSGNVGIGTASPQSKLNVVESSSSTSIGGSTAVLQVGNSNGAALNLTAGIELFGSGAPSSGLNNRSAGLYGVYEAYNASGNAGALVLATNPAGTTSVVERMRIDSSGNVGIGGTASASTKLNILGTLPTSGASSLGFYLNATIPSGSTGNAQGFRTNLGTEAAAFTCGDIYHFFSKQAAFGAGSTVTNQYGFFADANLTGATNNYGFYSNIASGSNRWNFYAAGTAANYMAGALSVGTTAAGVAGEIRATNNITAYYSDARLKDFKGKIDGALGKVSQLNGYYYTENEKAEEFGFSNKELQVGVSAQEVKAVLPEVVTAAPFDLDTDNKSKSGEDYMTVRYEKLVPLLIEAIKELTAKVEALEGKK